MLLRTCVFVLCVSSICSGFQTRPGRVLRCPKNEGCRLHSKPTRLAWDIAIHGIARCGGGGNPVLVDSSSSNAFFLTALLKNSWTALGNVMKSYPYTSAFVVVSIKTSLSDIFAQLTEGADDQGKDESSDSSVSPKDRSSFLFRLDRKRTLSFFLYGGIFLGCFYELMFNDVYPRLFGEGKDFRTVTSKIVLDLFLVGPTVVIPASYLVKAFVFSMSLRVAAEKYWHDVVKQKVLVKYWSFWIPFEIMLFTVIPPHLRVSSTALLSFFWLIIFSRLQSGKGKKGLKKS